LISASKIKLRGKKKKPTPTLRHPPHNTETKETPNGFQQNVCIQTTTTKQAQGQPFVISSNPTLAAFKDDEIETLTISFAQCQET
jgi:hypothetical protein